MNAGIMYYYSLYQGIYCQLSQLSPLLYILPRNQIIHEVKWKTNILEVLQISDNSDNYTLLPLCDNSTWLVLTFENSFLFLFCDNFTWLVLMWKTVSCFHFVITLPEFQHLKTIFLFLLCENLCGTQSIITIDDSIFYHSMELKNVIITF